MRDIILSLVLLTFLGCKKDEVSENSCHQAMKERFENELKCTEKDKMQVNLYSGIYEGKTIYFVNTMCPACNTIPPQFGYTCEGQKITISDFNTKVTQTKQVYNSCTKKFID